MGNHKRYDSYDRNSSEVYLGEYASWGNKLQNAIAEAAYMIGLERNGDVVRMASYAPMLAKKGFTQWRTDMVFFDNVNICPTPNFYVQQMFMANSGDRYFGDVISKNENDTTLAASCVCDSKTGDIILKLVNYSASEKPMKINLGKFGKIPAVANQTVLKGKPEDENTFENPDKIVPVHSEIKIAKKMDYQAPPMSLTVIRFKTNF